MAKADWTAIKAEYISGGISQRKLAEKYGVPFPTLRDRADRQEWAKERDKARDKAISEAVQKTVDKAASNAVLLEEARALAIKKIKKAIENIPENSGSHTRTFIQKDGKRLTVDYDLLDLVTALEKLTKNDMEQTCDAVTVIIDV